MRYLIIFTLILSGLLTTSASRAQQVSQGSYKGWQHFKPDTAAYLKYNWDADSIYNQEHRRSSLKSFFDTLELPVTVVEFRLIDRFIVGAVIYVTPYDKLMNIPLKDRSQFGMMVNFLPEFIVAAPYEERLSILKSRDVTKVDRIFVKWDSSYDNIFANLKYRYIIY